MSYRGKVILLGDAGVGKTSLLARYVDGIFRSEYIQTLGANFLIKEVDLINLAIQHNLQINKDKEIKMYIWDIGGQRDKLFVTEYYFINAIGALIVFDVTNKESFIDIEFWINKLIELNGNTPYIIVGNKCDLSSERVVSKSDLANAGKKHDTITFETSAKLSSNVDAAFEELFYRVLQDNQALLSR